MGTSNDAKLPAIFERCSSYWTLDLDGSWERQRRAQRSSFSRAVHTLYDKGIVHALALAWVNVEDEVVMRWQGGGRRKVRLDGYREGCPRFRRIGRPTLAGSMHERWASASWSSGRANWQRGGRPSTPRAAGDRGDQHHLPPCPCRQRRRRSSEGLRACA